MIGSSLARTARLAALAVVVAVAVAVTAPPAGAHAFLVSSSPPNQAVVPTQPALVRLTFNEPVDFGPHAIELLDAAGRTIETGPPLHAAGDTKTAALPLPPGLAKGTYIIAWRVVSVDSHPVSGGFSFSIGAPSAEVTAHGRTSSRAVNVADAVSRTLAFAGLALTVGGACLLLLLWPAGRASRRGRRLLWSGIGVLLGSSLLLLLLQGPYATGGSLTGVFDPSLLDFSTGTRFGQALVVRMALTVAFGVLAGLALYRRLHGPWLVVPGVALTLGLVSTWTLTDHSSTGTQASLGMPLGSVHLLAMALWLGGLTFLAACVLGRAAEDHVSLAPALPRFSRLGLACFAALGATGLYLTWRQVGTLAALPDTRFGQLLIVKSAIVVAIVVLAWFSRRVAERWYGRRSAGGEAPAGAVRRLRRTVAGEAVLGVVVLAVTAVLVNSVPARISYKPPLDITLAARDTTGSGLDGGKVQVLVKPAQQGANVADIYLTAGDGTLFPALEVTGRLQPPGGAGPLPAQVVAAEPGHFVVSPLDVPYTGRWVLKLAIRTSDIDETDVDVPLRIR